jgi:predicted ArsR family transcriptional regulator
MPHQEVHLVTKDITSATQEVIKTATDIDALLFHLRIEKNMTESEIASTLGIRKKFVTNHLNSVYAKIREVVE